MISVLIVTLTVLPYLMALLLGLMLPLLALAAYRRLGVGLAIVMLIFSAEALYMHLGGLRLGIAVYYTDFALVFVALVALLRLLLAADAPALPRAWWLYVAVFAISLGSGLVTLGTSAGVQARQYFYAIAVASYAATFPVQERQLRAVFDMLSAAGALLVGLVIYRWIVFYLPIHELLPEEGAYNTDGEMRVIRSYETLLLAQLLVLGIFFPHASRGLWLMRLMSPLLLALVIGLQHRSVWVALIAGVVAALAVARSRSGSRAGQLALLVVVLFLTALPALFSERLQGVTGQVATSAGNALAGRGTAGERVDGWRSIVQRWATSGPRSIAIGQAFGTDNSRYVADTTRGGVRKVDYFAHNLYVQTLFNMGLLGLGALLWTAAQLARGLYRRSACGEGGAASDALLVLLLMQLIYYVPYGNDYLQFSLFGLAMGLLGARAAARTAPPSASAPGERQAAASAPARWSTA